MRIELQDKLHWISAERFACSQTDYSKFLPSLRHHVLFCFLLLFIATGLYSPGIAISQELPAPLFSNHSGFYSDSFNLEISTDVEGAVILYTLDGSKPNPDHIGGAMYELEMVVGDGLTERVIETFVYSSPLEVADRSSRPNSVSTISTHYSMFSEPATTIAKATVVRAAVFAEDQTGPVSTQTYFVGEHMKNFLELPVLSLAVQEDALWSYEEGIIVPGKHFDPNRVPIWRNNGNPFQRGQEWEREIHVEYFDQSGISGFFQRAGIRIHGGTSRRFVNRSMRLYARSDYGKNTIEYPLFPNRGAQVHKRLKLRTSGQDYENTYFRDALMSRLMMESESTVEDYRPVNLFINGEYWGITNIRERFDHHYAERNFGIPRDEVEILSSWGRTNEHYSEFRNFIEESSPDDPDYYQEVNKRIYLDSLLDLRIAEIFFGRWDIHWEVWRDGRNIDNRWRWVMWDFDVGMLLPNFTPAWRDEWQGPDEIDITVNYLERFLDDYYNSTLNWEFSEMMKNLEVQQRFLNRLALMMSTNLSDEFINNEIDRIKTKLEPSMPHHIERWRSSHGRIGNMENWYNQIEILRDFANRRQEIIYQQAVDYFGLPGIATLEIEKAAGEGIVLLDDEPLNRFVTGYEYNTSLTYWSGTLFRDVPITLTAKPEAGYRFVGWTGDIDSHEQSIELNLSSSISVRPVFEEHIEVEGDDMNPVPHLLSTANYEFSYWSPDEPEGSFPANMVFQQSSVNDPGLQTGMTHPYHVPYANKHNNEYHENDQDKIGFPYSLTGRTRVNALGDRGISLINTGRGRDLGAVVLALDMRDVEEATINWTAETLQANSRVYHIRLQYRIGFFDEWKDVIGSDGEIVEYQRKETSGEFTFENIPVPSDAYDEPYIQLRWKYYFTGERISQETGRRDELRIDNIKVINSDIEDEAEHGDPESVAGLVNFPNPFYGSTTIRFVLDEADYTELSVFTIHGRLVSMVFSGELTEGMHQFDFEGSGLATGIYMYRVRTSQSAETAKMILIR